MRVMLIDDYDATARVFQRLFTHAGHEAIVVNQPQLALEAAKSFCPDVVITDIAMPEMDGYAVARILKEECGINARIIALTAFPPSTDVERTRYIDAHASKPVPFRKLLAMALGSP